MKKRMFSAFLILLVAASLVFAQGAAEVKTDEKTTVSVMIWTSSYDQKIEPNNIEARFEEAYPQYDLVFEQVEYDSLDSQTLLAHNTGNDYDVIMVNHSSLPMFVSGGVVAPMDDVVAQLDMEYYSEKAVNASKFGEDRKSVV